MQLSIITPEATAYEGEADSVVLTTRDGEIGILPGHLPLTTLVEAGNVTVTRAGKSEDLAVDRGFAEVSGDEIRILTEAAVGVGEIDLEAVERAEERARRYIEEAEGQPHADPYELEQAHGSLRFALVQRLAKGRKRR